MTRISVDTTFLATASEALQRTGHDAEATADGVGALAHLLDWRIAAGEQYHRRILRLQAALLREARLLERHSTFLSYARSTYHVADVRVAGLVRLSAGELLEALGDFLRTRFGVVLMTRLLGLWDVFATRGIVGTVTTLVGWALAPTTVDRGQIEQRLQDDYLKESLRKLHELPGLSQADWDKADLEGRKKIIRALAAEAAAIYGVHVTVEFYDEAPRNDKISRGWNDGEGKLHINEYIIRHSGYSASMGTVFHELRHQYQADSMNRPDDFLVDDQTIDAWKKDSGANYIQPDVDFDGYWAQVKEVDARDFGGAAET